MAITAIVLAAGQGTRMKSSLPKVLHKVNGKSLVQWVLDCLKAAGIQDKIVVLGHGSEKVENELGVQVDYAYQQQQLGTGHAVMQAVEKLPKQNDTVIVLCGDTPLLRAETIQQLIQKHEIEQNAITILTAIATQPFGYGRIVRGNDSIQAIVEEKDATEEQKKIQEINTGTYCFDQQFLLTYLETLTTNNAQGEYYLTDLIGIAKTQKLKINGYCLEDFEESLGVNNRVQLAQADYILRQRKCRDLMMDGVTIIDPQQTYVEESVIIGRDTILYPGSVIQGKTTIGTGNIIGANCRIVDSAIGDDNEIQQSVLTEAVVGNGCKIGPFAYLRPKANLADAVKIGDFVEVKNSTIGVGSKLPHLSYVGDSDIGCGVNIGCGTITCNYDGINKYRTIVEDHAFIGSNTNLVAPVTVHTNAFIAAGSTITDDVPQDSLALTRAPLTVKEDWVLRKKQK